MNGRCVWRVVKLGRHRRWPRRRAHETFLGLDEEMPFKGAIDTVDALVLPAELFDVESVATASPPHVRCVVVRRTSQSATSTFSSGRVVT